MSDKEPVTIRMNTRRDAEGVIIATPLSAGKNKIENFKDRILDAAVSLLIRSSAWSWSERERQRANQAEAEEKAALKTHTLDPRDYSITTNDGKSR